MSGTDVYHGGLQQPYRIQKRLVLNQCFKSILAKHTIEQTLTYVTFGGEDLYDVMDLVSVFDIRRLKLRILSYEENDTVAVKSRTCPVAATLSRIDTVSVEIVSSALGDNHLPIRALRSQGRFIYFLDDTRTFREPHAEVLLELLRSELLRQGDYLLITSCLTPRVVNQPRFMLHHQGTYRTFFGPRIPVDQEFRVRNHVDLFVALMFSRYQGIRAGQGKFLRASLMRKFRYNDTRAVMGLWLYQLDFGADRRFALRDIDFEQFPHAFARAPAAEEIPNIFED
jgi:hypothetical protein